MKHSGEQRACSKVKGRASRCVDCTRQATTGHVHQCDCGGQSSHIPAMHSKRLYGKGRRKVFDAFASAVNDEMGQFVINKDVDKTASNLQKLSDEFLKA